MKRAIRIVAFCLLVAIVCAVAFHACSVARSHREGTPTVRQQGTVAGWGWLEIPTDAQGPGGVVVTHWAELNGDTVRNYTACYDTAAMIARWVAYPLHPCYTGTHARKDRWGYDPQVGREWQVDISRRGYGEGFDRGHQLPSGDRTANKTLNEQTFYATNATAQRSSFNRGVWNSLEGRVRDMMTRDTMYVVTGAVTDTPPEICANGSAVPRHYFKVVLYMRDGEWRSIGFWFDHDAQYRGGVDLEQALTVREVERRAGLDFFTNLPHEVQESVETVIHPADWGLQ